MRSNAPWESLNLKIKTQQVNGTEHISDLTDVRQKSAAHEVHVERSISRMQLKKLEHEKNLAGTLTRKCKNRRC